jgi:hypothetical protein
VATAARRHPKGSEGTRRRRLPPERVRPAMSILGLLGRLCGTFLMALAIAVVAWYLYLTEAWAKDLGAYNQGKQ